MCTVLLTPLIRPVIRGPLVVTLLLLPRDRYVYWSQLLVWQQAFACVVAVREATYVVLLLLCCWFNPAFLLVNIPRSMASMHNTLHPINGWFFLVAPAPGNGINRPSCRTRGKRIHT
jgi:hypothetical protein